MNIDQLLALAVKKKASDLHISAGVEATARIHGKLVKLSDQPVTREDSLIAARHILSDRDIKKLEANGEVDTSYAIKNVSRFRVNTYRQRGSVSIAFRVVSDFIPSMEELNLPMVLKDLSKKQRGLILVTGPTGSGKSTTLASMIDYMNMNLNHHVITIEDPIEYLHIHKNCIIDQREVGADTINFANALRAALREDPDVILVGEMRDLETINTALTAAETGHLVLSTLHTIGAAKTIDRIIDVFPPEQQQQVKVQLAAVLEGVISQQILPRIDGQGRLPAFEIMLANPAIRNLVREGKTHQIQTIIQTSKTDNMQTMDGHLITLYQNRKIDLNTLMRYAVDTQFVNETIRPVI